MFKIFFFGIEDFGWNIRCKYGFWLHGPYGLAKVIEKIPFKFLIKYLRKYGATIGDDCRFERGINIHRPFGRRPFENLIIGNAVYLGHNTLIDLSGKVVINDKVIIASYCQIWTHTSNYLKRETTNPQYDENTGEVNIGEGAIIYSGVVIIQGLKIGSFASIGANSFINKDVEANILVGGVPAKFIKTLV
jgi:acetyltransferase-like isoleucine patch superfamily enzyme